MTISIGATVRPASDGEDSRGRLLQWSKLTGTVVDTWVDCGEVRVQVRWHQKNPYPRCLPASWLCAV